MKFSYTKSLVIYFSLSFFGYSAQASLVSEIVASLGSEFVELSESVAGLETRAVAAAGASVSEGVMGGAGHAAESHAWLSKKPVSQLLFTKVLGHNPSAFIESKYCPTEHLEGTHPMCPHLAVDGVRYYSAGNKDSIDEFLDALNDLARAEKSPYRFRLPLEEEFLRSVNSRAALFTGLAEWTASRASKPFISKMVIQYKPFQVKSLTHQEVIFDRVSAAQMERKYLHPEFFSEKTRLSFRIIVEIKPAIAGALEWSE